MTNLEKLYIKLKEYRQDFENEDNIDKFADTVEEIISKKDPSCFPILLSYFNDADRIDFVFENLESSIQEFEPETYVKELLGNIYVMIPHAKERAAEMLFGILNHPDYNKLMDKYLHLANKQAMKEVFEQMIEFEPDHHRARIDELLNKLESNQVKP